MAVRKEKKCFSSCYAKTQSSDYVIRVLDASRTVLELFESQKHTSRNAQTTYKYYANNSNEPTIQERVFFVHLFL